MSDLSILYSDEIVSYAKNMFREGKLHAPHAMGSAYSKICGSTIHLELKFDGDSVVDYGQIVKACVLGRAAASMVGEVIIESQVEEIEEASTLMRQMLMGSCEGPSGKWRQLSLFAPARDFKSRHGSILLVFDALETALRYRSQLTSGRSV